MSLDLSVLGIKEEDMENIKDADIPDEVGFSSSLHAFWRVQDAHMVKCYAGTEIGDIEYIFKYTTQNGEQDRYYFSNKNDADAVHDEHGIPSQGAFNYKSERFLIMRPDIKTVVGWQGGKSPEEVFNYELFYSVPSRQWNSKQAYQFQLMTLPSLVQSVAKLLGAIDEDVFNYDELASTPVNSVIAQADELTGYVKDAYGKPTKGKVPLEQTILGSARKDLWEKLGSSNWKGNKGHGETHIQSILNAIYGNPLNIWASIAKCPDPCGNEDEEGVSKNYPIPVFTAIYASREAAEAVVGKSKKSEPVLDYPEVPEAYEGVEPDEFFTILQEGMPNTFGAASKTAAKKEAKGEMDDMELTMIDISPWIDFRFDNK